MNPGGIGKLKGVLSLGTPIFFKGPHEGHSNIDATNKI